MTLVSVDTLHKNAKLPEHLLSKVHLWKGARGAAEALDKVTAAETLMQFLTVKVLSSVFTVLKTIDLINVTNELRVQ